jgi:redox-sensitive bicupin YhaK (pirin superfamily)
LLQIWIQPDQKGVTPRYEEKSFAQTPKGALHRITSKSGRGGSIAIHQDAELWLARLDAGQRVAHTLAAGRHAWLQVAEGEVTLNGETLRGGDAASFSEATVLELRATQAAQVLLFDLS